MEVGVLEILFTFLENVNKLFGAVNMHSRVISVQTKQLTQMGKLRNIIFNDTHPDIKVDFFNYTSLAY